MHGRSRKHQLLGRQELGGQVVGVAQQGVLEASYVWEEDGGCGQVISAISDQVRICTLE